MLRRNFGVALWATALCFVASHSSSAQDTVAECQAIADEFGTFVVDVNGYAYACMEEDGADDIPDMGIQGIMYCSTDATCPAAHRTSADSLGLDCAMGGFRSVCPCN